MKYKKKPVIVEAVQYTGNNFVDIVNWSKLSPKKDIEEERNKDKNILNIFWKLNDMLNSCFKYTINNYFSFIVSLL